MSELQDDQEIEVTFKMVAAGLAALWPVELPATEIPEQVVQRVFRAMETARSCEGGSKSN